MNNVLLTLGALLVGILCALVAVPMVVDWNTYRGAFEEEASRILGRDVRVGGSVAVRLLPAPYIRFEKLRVADTASTSGDPLFRADSLTMRLSVGALLRGALEADQVDLQRPTLRLSVDKNGQGNWSALQIAPGALPFLPSNVALKSVDITGGTLTLVGTLGRDLAVFEAIDGEFAADSVTGPYRFKGGFKVNGQPPAEASRDIRVSAGEFEPDGSVRVRATTRATSTGNTYNFDGKLIDLRDRLKVDGELTAKLPIASGKDTKTQDLASAYDLKAKLTGDANGIRLADLSLALDSLVDPQLITGDVSTNWAAVPRFDMALASKSLNLDRFAAAGPNSDPLDTARAALNTILAAIPADAEATASLRADRVILAGETVTGVTVAMARTGPVLELKSLRAELPGSTRLEATGVVSRDTRTLSFAGPVRVRGTNLARFTGWAKGRVSDPSTKDNERSKTDPLIATARPYDGPFALAGNLTMAGGSIDLKSASADFGGMLVTGELNVQNEGRRKIALNIDAGRFDLAQLWPGGFDPAALRTLLTGANSASAAPSSEAGRPQAGDNGLFLFDPATADLDLTLSASELRAGLDKKSALELKDVEIAAKVTGGALTLDRLKFVTASGLDADIEARIDGLPGTPSAELLPKAAARTGIVRFTISAPSATAIKDALDLADIPTADRPSDGFLSKLGPTRLAGTINIGGRARAQELDATFDGAIDGGRVYGKIGLDGGLVRWRSAPLVAEFAADSPHVEHWLGLSGLAATQTDGARVAGRGTVFVRGEGTPETGLTVYSTFASRDLSAVYQGLVTLPRGSPAKLAGIVALTARDATDALALAGIAPGLGTTNAPVSGQVRLAHVDNALVLETSGLTVGGSVLNGTATVTGAGTPVRTVTARIGVDTVSVPGVLAALSDRRVSNTDGEDAVWPADPLTLTTLDGLTGTITLTAQRAVVDGAVGLNDLRAMVAIQNGQFKIDGIQAAALGGTLTGQAVLDRAQGGSRLTASVALDGADISKLNRGAAVPASAKLTMTGQGISARGIVSAMSGSGEATVGSGKIAGVAPAAVAIIANRVLETRELPSIDQVSNEVRRALEASVLDVKTRKLPIKIADGAVQIASPPLETDAGRASFDVVIDLAGLRQTHNWRIEAKTTTAPSGRVKGLLPPIIITTSGSLAAPDDWTTAVNLTAFEQELSLRKIERDADELELARKLAEDARLKAEAEEAARLTATKAAADDAANAAVSQSKPASEAQPAAQLQSGSAPETTQNPGAAAGSTVSPPVPISVPQPRPVRPPSSGPRRGDDVFLRPFQTP